jgi:PAS domain S-box-containing protein
MRSNIPRPCALDIVGWREAADSLPAMVFTAKSNGFFDFVNRRWLEVTGYDRDQLIGDNWLSIVHAEDVDRVSAVWQHAANSADRIQVECRIRKADGNALWVSLSAGQVYDGGGQLAGWFGLATDIDELKYVEQTLRERELMLADSERRLRVLAEAVPIVCWTADARGWIDWYNRQWYVFTGQTPEESTGWGWQSACHPDDLLDVMRRWPHSIETGEPFEMECRLRRHDGVFRWFLTRAHPMRDDEGNVVRWYGSTVDIESQKAALERAKRIADTLQDIFLPKRLPQAADLRTDAVYVAAERDALVGGDWFDALELPDGRIVFSIGDVVGHGLPASVLAGMLRQAIAALAFGLDDPSAILKQVNAILEHHEPESMATALVGFIDRSHTSMTFASAGHPPPLLATHSNELAAVLSAGGAPLGSGLGLDFETRTVALEKDAVVALYTDGVVEFSRDIAAEELKLRNAVAQLVGDVKVDSPAFAIQQAVRGDMRLRDDAALLLMQFSRVNRPAASSHSAKIEKTWRFHSSDARAAQAARHDIMSYLRSMTSAVDETFSSELILGEIIANTVEHAPGLVEIHLDWSADKPVLTVRDSGPGLKSLETKLPSDQMSESGRGLFLIRLLADRLTVRRGFDDGTELRTTLPLSKRRFRLADAIVGSPTAS